jgi:hypothetical protein
LLLLVAHVLRGFKVVLKRANPYPLFGIQGTIGKYKFFMILKPFEKGAEHG